MSNWIYNGVYPWRHAFTTDSSEVGDGTFYPRNTGYAPTWDLYWKPKLLTMTYQYVFDGGSPSGETSAAGEARCSRALKLAAWGGKSAVVTDNLLLEDENRITITFQIDPASKRVVPNESTDLGHWLKMYCFGTFRTFSRTQDFTTALTGSYVGDVTIVANPGDPATFVFPIYAVPTDPPVISSLDVQISRVIWPAEEL